jgi:hypothetical protein
MSKKQKLLDELYEEFCSCRGLKDTNDKDCFKMYLEKYANATLKLALKKLNEDINGRD